MNIYVGNLPWETTEEELRHLFEEHGPVDKVQIIVDRETGNSRGFGFVEMSSHDHSKSAIEALNGLDLGGRELKVNEARPRNNDGRRGGGQSHGSSSRGGRGGRGHSNPYMD